MIDERDVVAARSWEQLKAMQSRSQLSEGEFEVFLLMMVAITCVAHDFYDSQTQVERGSQAEVQSLIGNLLQTARGAAQGGYQTAWREAGDLLAARSGVKENARVDWGNPASPEVLVNVVAFIDSVSPIPGTSYLVALYDEGFHRLLARVSGRPYRFDTEVAELAAQTSLRARSMVDFFSTAGEAMVLRKAYGHDDHEPARILPVDQVRLLIGIRLYIHRIPAEVLVLTAFADARVKDQFILIDHPARQPSSSAAPPDDWRGSNSSLTLLDGLLQRSHGFDTALVVVPGADRTGAGWKRDLRRHLVRTGRLVAVIDMPASGSRRQASAWLLGEEGAPSDVLFIDARHLAAESGERDPAALMALVVGVIELAVPRRWPLPGVRRTARLDTDGVKAMLQSLFRNGYQDVPSLCRIVSEEELDRSGFRLTAATFLQSRPGMRSRTWRSLLDPSPVTELLVRPGALALRIYVIGNNGVGKSILLKDLAQRLSGQGLRTVGIAFGLTDRFDYKNAAEGSSTFLYDGARTTERSIALGRTSIDLIKLIRGIHLDPRRLATFDALVRHLGFGERRYLVPIDLSRDPDHARSRYAELKALSVNAAENAAVFDGEALSRITLGLMREDASESITTFPDLSSGEQQLLMLAVKITAHADSTTVLLVDEPEISMHVSWQRAIPRMLEIVSSRTRCSIVVATHSPVIIASATLDGDRCFVARDHRLTELELRQRRSVETALFDGFATHTANNRQVYERCAGLVSEAIRLMNAPAHQSSAERATQIDGFLAELERMRSTISGASPMQTQMEHVELDLDLVAKTRQAIEEIVRVGAGVDA